MSVHVKKIIKHFFWIFPFISFIFGYYLLHCFLQKKQLDTPNIIGKTLQASMNDLSKNGLSVRLLREQEDPDLPEGIVLNQIPRPNQKVRPNQHVFVTISKKPKEILTPEFWGQNQKYINLNSTKLGIHSKIFWLKSLYTANTCIAQYPQPDQELTQRKLITYLSLGGETLFVVPNLKDCIVSDLKERFNKENIKVDVFTRGDESNNIDSLAKIVDQKPMPGSIVDLGKILHIQVQV